MGDSLRKYLISVIDPLGGVIRKIILHDELYHFFSELRSLELSRGNECHIIEDYDIFGRRQVRNYWTVIELIEDQLTVYVFGAGHVGMAVALLCSVVGYKVIVLDDREQFLKRIRDVSIAAYEVRFSNLSYQLDSNSAAVIVTRGHQFDEMCLEYVLKFDLRYVGMIGSKRRVLSIFKRLENQGVSSRLLTGVFSPIGLNIGARTPMEIGISIVAEIISVINK